MADKQAGAVAHNGMEFFHNMGFGLCVDGGEDIVENQQFRPAGDRAADGGALALSAGEGYAALAEHGLVLFREGFDVGTEVRVMKRYDGVAHREPDLEVRGDTLLPLPEEEIVVLSDAAFEDSFVEPEVLRIHSGWIWQAELSQSLPRELTEVVNSDHKMP